MRKDKPEEQIKSIFEKVWDESQRCSSSDLSIIVKKQNEIIKQTNKNTERILRIYEIVAGK